VQKLIAVLDDAMRALLAPLALIASGLDTAAALHDRYRQRLGQLLHARPTMIDDMLSEETSAVMTSGRPFAGGFHLLIMDLHTELKQLQADISTKEIDGAQAYSLSEGERPLIAVFIERRQENRPA
jgi:hypothetical protein